MKVLFTCYPTAFQAPAGGEVQLLKTYEAVRRLGVKADLFNPFKHRIADYDVVHHFSYDPGGEAIIRYAREHGVKVALSTIVWVDSESRFPIDYVRGMSAYADVLLPNSRMEVERLASTLSIPTSRFHVVYNGIDEVYAKKPDPRPFRKKFGLDKFVLCTARFDFRKNQLGLIRALKGTDLPVVFIGGARDQAYFEACRKEAGPNMHFLGAMPSDAPLLRSAYAAAEVFVMPGLLETPGLAALEAGASGAKLVITQEGSTKEYFGDTARYVHPFAYREIREAVLAAWKAPRTERTRKRILSKFMWEDAGKSTLAAYKKILTSPKTQNPAPPSQPWYLDGLSPRSTLDLGKMEFQIRLGWGAPQATPAGHARPINGTAAFCLLNNGGRRLRIEGFSESGGSLRVLLAEQAIGTLQLEPHRFAAELDVPAHASEILEFSLESSKPEGAQPLKVRSISLS